MTTFARTGFVQEAAPIVVSASLRFKAGGGKDKVKREGHCRMCLRAIADLRDLPNVPDAVRVMTRHHLVPKAWFRLHPEWLHLQGCEANVVPLCRACHDLVELPDHRGGLEYRRELRRMMTQAEVAFVIQMREKRWLEKRYPLRITLSEPAVNSAPAKRHGTVFDLWIEMYGAKT